MAGKSRIPRGSHLHISLRQFVGVARILNHSASVFDWSEFVGDLRHQAVMGAAGKPILDWVAANWARCIAKFVCCIIDVEETSKERPGVLSAGNRLVVYSRGIVVSGTVIQIIGGKEW